MEIEDNISSLQMYLLDKKVAHQAKSFPKCFVLTPKVFNYRSRGFDFSSTMRWKHSFHFRYNNKDNNNNNNNPVVLQFEAYINT